MLSVRIAIGKILLLSMALISGITVGREGPSVHVAACCMHLSRRFCRFHPWLVQRGLILAGSAAGIAAARVDVVEAADPPTPPLGFVDVDIWRLERRRSGE